MKNYTLRSLYLTMMVLLALAPKNAKAQCVAPTLGSAMTPTSTYQQILTQSGRYYTFTANAGCTYTFTHCQGGGNAPIGTDPVLTLTDASNTIITFNDDAGGICGGSAGSQIIWTAPASGTYRIHHCASSVQNATMAYRVQCPCISGTAFASPNVVCFGQTTTLTLSGQSPGSTFQWQQSPDNTNFTNISGATVSPYVTGPLSVTTYFRAIITCDGVTGNAVGADTTASVQVTVNALPSINFTAVNPLCCNSTPVTLTATPAGGTFSAPVGVSGNQFSPIQACSGTTTVTYSYTDGNNCTNQATQNIVVNDTPAINWPAITQSYCISNCGSFPINTATPAGGVYDDFMPAVFVNGNNITPCVAGTPGLIPIRYTLTNLTTGCTSQALNFVNINPLPSVQVFDIPDGCLGSPDVQMSGNPSGGTFSSVTGTITPGGLFSYTPAGNHTIDYVYTDPTTTCANIASVNVQVFAYPTITWQLGFPTLCVNSAVLNLNGYATPGGGTWGNGVGNTGVVGNTFNPALVTPGTYWITYTVSNNGCTSKDSQQITVIAAPTVNFVNGPVPPVCVGSAPFSLTGYTTPAGGTWSLVPAGGSTVNTTTGVFTPSAAGTYTITYNYVQGSCQNNVTFQVTVNPLPLVNLPATLPNICENAVAMLLNQGLPAGGTYTGLGVTTPPSPQYFNPSLVGTGGYTLTYTYTDANNCTNFDTAHIFVTDPPNINFPPIADVCDESAAFQLLATPVGGVFSNPNAGYVTGSNPYFFNPIAAPVGNHIITYIYNDVGTGCADTAQQNVLVKPIPGALTISNIVNPTTCGNNNGSFRINGLLPNTNYQLEYYQNGVYNGIFNITSNGAGQYTRNNLTAGIYNPIIVSLNGCSQQNTNITATLTDPNAPAPPTAGSNSPVCQYSTIQLTATSPVVNGAYTWSGPVSFFSNQQNATRANAQTNHSGTYSVTVTNPANNCTSLPGTVTVTVNPAPNLTMSSNSPVCQGSTLNLNASSTTPNTSFFWQGPNAFNDAQGVTSIPGVTSINAGWYRVTVTNGTTGCTRTDSVNVVVGTVIPSAPSANGNTPVCSGQTLNLTATNSTPGASYLWGGPNSFSANVQNPTRPNMQLADEGLYYVRATLNGCQSDTNSVWIDVIQSLSPTITIAATPDDTVCFGTNINFTSVITDGGTAPQYQWYINGVPVIGAIDSFWGSPYLTDLDTITAVLINATSCTTAASDTSNKITIHMSPNTIPTVLIGSDPLLWVAGQPMTFTAYPLNAGSNPTYQWYLNGVILPGETFSTFNSSTLTDQDILTVVVNSDAPCAIPDTATDDWNAITNLGVNVGGKTIEDMKLFPNPNDGTFMLMGTFKGMTGAKPVSLEVVNAVGQVVYSETATVQNGKLDKQIKTTDISAGVYMLRISAEGYATQMKFVVNK
jgi:hypothetical protein